MEIEGIIEAISYKTKGIKVAGRWFNVPEELLNNLQKNQKVKISIDDFGNVLDVQILGFEEIIDKDIKIEALRSSIEIMKLYFQISYADFTYASEIKKEKDLELILKDLNTIYRRILEMLK